MSIGKGSVFGNGGKLEANVSSSGTITAADSSASTGALNVGGNYSQNSGGALDVNLAGSASGQFNVFSVTGSAKLNGTLNIKLLNNFVPAIGSTFRILTATPVTGKFTTVNGTKINSSEHFTVQYNSTNVTLLVASGP